MPDTTLYDLRTKIGVLEESPSGRLLLDDEPLQDGDVIWMEATLGRRVPVRVHHDGHEWYGVIVPHVGERAREIALLPRMRAFRRA